MNQERIGKFIATVRKKQNLTQAELAEKLGITYKAVSKWECGKGLPDASIMLELCKILHITVNDLLSGEKLKQNEYQNKSEENIVNTIDYSTKKITKYNHVISLILIIFGLFIALSAITIFPSESSWGSIYSCFGVIIFMLGIARLTKGIKWYKRLLIIIAIFILTMGILLFTNYLNVKLNKEAPRFRIITSTTGDVIYYDNLFYDVYRCYFDKDNEYWVISKNTNPATYDLLNYCK